MGASEEAKVNTLSKEELVAWLKANCSDISGLDVAYIEEKEIDGSKISAMSVDQLKDTFDFENEADASKLHERIANANRSPEETSTASTDTGKVKDPESPPEPTSTTSYNYGDSGGANCCCCCDNSGAKASETGCCCCECNSCTCLCDCAKGWYECCHIKFYRPLAALFLYACLGREDGYWTRTVAVAIAPLVVLAFLLCLLFEGLIWLLLIIIAIVLLILAIACFCLVALALGGGNSGRRRRY
jgi:hypothetical protein